MTSKKWMSLRGGRRPTRQSQGSLVWLKCSENRCQETATAPSGPHNDKQKTDVIARRPQADVAIRTFCRQSSSVQKYPSLRGPTSFVCPKEVGKKTTHRGAGFLQAALPLCTPSSCIGSLSGLTVGQGASRPLPLPKAASGGTFRHRPIAPVPGRQISIIPEGDTSILHS